MSAINSFDENQLFRSSIRSSRIVCDDKNQDSFTQYEIHSIYRLSPQDTRSYEWSVWKRFNEFQNLHKKLCKYKSYGKIFKKISFPPAESMTVDIFSESFIRKRKEKLGKYWSEVISSPPNADLSLLANQTPLSVFLNLKDVLADNFLLKFKTKNGLSTTRKVITGDATYDPYHCCTECQCPNITIAILSQFFNELYKTMWPPSSPHVEVYSRINATNLYSDVYKTKYSEEVSRILYQSHQSNILREDEMCNTGCFDYTKDAHCFLNFFASSASSSASSSSIDKKMRSGSGTGPHVISPSLDDSLIEVYNHNDDDNNDDNEHSNMQDRSSFTEGVEEESEEFKEETAVDSENNNNNNNNKNKNKNKNIVSSSRNSRSSSRKSTHSSDENKQKDGTHSDPTTVLKKQQQQQQQQQHHRPNPPSRKPWERLSSTSRSSSISISLLDPSPVKIVTFKREEGEREQAAYRENSRKDLTETDAFNKFMKFFEENANIHHGNWGKFPKKLLFMGFNRIKDGFTIGSNNILRKVLIDPYHEEVLDYYSVLTSDFKSTITNVYKKSELIIVVGSNEHPQYSDTHIYCWDIRRKVNKEMVFEGSVLSIGINLQCFVVVLLHKTLIYETSSLVSRGAVLLHEIITVDNPTGLFAQCKHNSLKTTAVLGSEPGVVTVITHTKMMSIKAHRSVLSAISFSLDGTIFATASFVGTVIRIFETKTGSVLKELRRGTQSADIYSLCFNPTMKYISCCSDKKSVHIFKIDDGSKVSTKLSSKTGKKICFFHESSNIFYILHESSTLQSFSYIEDDTAKSLKFTSSQSSH